MEQAPRILNLPKRVRVARPGLAALVITLAVGVASGRFQDAVEKQPSFAVASIKPSQPEPFPRQRMGPLPGGEGYEARHVSVHRMIATVYHVIPGQIEGAPSWADSEPYDVEAKAEQPGNREQLDRMFQRLLGDRFKLQFHRETRQLPLYELAVDKGGSKLTINETADEFSGRVGPNLMKPGNPGLPGMTGVGVTMSAFCWNLSQILQRPVVDKTDLKAYYDFRLEYATALPGSPTPVPDGSDPPPQLEGPSIFSALREQLGLRLDARKGPVEILVIDHIEKPASN